MKATHDTNSNNPNNYNNPRIDRDEPLGNAVSGAVYLDIGKSIWVVSMLLIGTIGSLMTASVGAIVLFISFTALTLLFGHSLGMHRRFIHRGYACPKWMEYLFVHLGTIVGLAGPFGMLKTHDMRDWAQRQSHCHAYFSHASVWYKDAYWQILHSLKLDTPPPFEPESEIADDPVYQWMETHWMLQQLPWAILFFAIGGWGWVCWGIASRVSVSIIGHWLIGYFAHNHGHRDWHVEGAAVQGHNIKWTALLTMGECWHNNHHAFPASAKLGLEQGQWDPGWWTLIALEKLGLVKDLVTPEKIQTRDELVRL
ncbi:MAG: stearoyl-CoA desaturase (delta-9 desaturase) [Arenicella sp.]|jgi:stearoyl-CoA desaturase (delta-9 desaturase)